MKIVGYLSGFTCAAIGIVIALSTSVDLPFDRGTRLGLACGAIGLIVGVVSAVAGIVHQRIRRLAA